MKQSLSNMMVMVVMILGSVLSHSGVAQQSSPLKLQRAVTLKAEATALSQVICLDDLVEEGWVQSRCAIDKKSCCLWNLEGQKSKVFQKQELEIALSKMNLSGVHLQLTGSDSIVVTQTHREVNSEEIKTKILQKLQASPVASQGEVTVTEVTIQGNVYLPLEDQEWTIQLPESISQNSAIRILSSSAQTPQLIGWAKAKITIKDEVYVSKKTIRAMDAIKIEDFELRKIDVLSPLVARSEGMIRRAEFPANMRARNLIPPGATLAQGSVERTPAVQLGEAVTLILRSDNLKVSTRGVVQGPAAIGDMISVQLKTYGRTFRGRLLEGKQVEVWL